MAKYLFLPGKTKRPGGATEKVATTIEVARAESQAKLEKEFEGLPYDRQVEITRLMSADPELGFRQFPGRAEVEEAVRRAMRIRDDRSPDADTVKNAATKVLQDFLRERGGPVSDSLEVEVGGRRVGTGAEKGTLRIRKPSNRSTGKNARATMEMVLREKERLKKLIEVAKIDQGVTTGIDTRDWKPLPGGIPSRVAWRDRAIQHAKKLGVPFASGQTQEALEARLRVLERVEIGKKLVKDEDGHRVVDVLRVPRISIKSDPKDAVKASKKEIDRVVRGFEKVVGLKTTRVRDAEGNVTKETVEEVFGTPASVAKFKELFGSRPQRFITLPASQRMGGEFKRLNPKYFHDNGLPILAVEKGYAPTTDNPLQTLLAFDTDRWEKSKSFLQQEAARVETAPRELLTREGEWSPVTADAGNRARKNRVAFEAFYRVSKKPGEKSALTEARRRASYDLAQSGWPRATTKAERASRNDRIEELVPLYLADIWLDESRPLTAADRAAQKFMVDAIQNHQMVIPAAPKIRFLPKVVASRRREKVTEESLKAKAESIVSQRLGEAARQQAEFAQLAFNPVKAEAIARLPMAARRKLYRQEREQLAHELYLQLMASRHAAESHELYLRLRRGYQGTHEALRKREGGGGQSSQEGEGFFPWDAPGSTEEEKWKSVKADLDVRGRSGVQSLVEESRARRVGVASEDEKAEYARLKAKMAKEGRLNLREGARLKQLERKKLDGLGGLGFFRDGLDGAGDVVAYGIGGLVVFALYKAITAPKA